MASLLSTLLAPVYNYIFIFSCGFGLAGAAFANGELVLVQVCALPGARASEPVDALMVLHNV